MSTPTPKSKTLATWLAVLGGTLGAHRFYLHGLKDPIAWLHPLPTLVGLAGVIRMRNLGQDDTVSWLLIPILGAMISVAMFSAILIGLTNDERWAERHGAGHGPQATGWGPVLGVVVALFLGAGVLMGSIAFGGQKYFEWQKEKAAVATAALD
ncbi:NINE protein [Ideonella paludis]|uniref:TM2 domain-containing protein n=1 Tax=Ideonella paludis TaxID=1233411 RepID=A0ABS5E0K5_9BURK|nr:NINE protein [Ideonella paludis]MBQ0936922.1 TM2 domain-containing protein [Ideonella paludis]